MDKLNLGRLLIGRPLATKELPHQAISRPVGLAVFASDALSSTAYATEEILITLASAVAVGATASAAGSIFGLSIPIAIAISILLVIVTISYRQTIYAYPNGGGAYIVARDNLGEVPAQIAGAALLTDYILTVAVSISSGVAQITSFPAFRGLQPYRVYMAVAVIILITVVNLRGVKESGRIFAVPTYFFLTMMFLTLGAGLIQFFTGALGTVDPESVAMFHQETLHNLGLFLILSAFSRGCTALTGIEAISNGIQAFKQPRSHNAAVTLIWMSSTLIVLFLGITFLAHQVVAIPSHSETIISQMARTIHGDSSIFYALTLAGTALILLMAANTSYADFPRLAALAAADGFLPRQLTYRGGRLVFSWGIMLLAVFAITLVVLFNASTTNLIPLYAIGVFLSFTISQTGMVIHARRTGKLKPGESVQGLETVMEYDPHWRKHMLISGFGALCTFVVMLVFAITKFTEGAWFILVLLPTLVYIFFRIHRHYKDVAKALSWESVPPDPEPRVVQTLILVDDVHAETVRLVNFAKSLGHPWRAIHVGVNPEKAEKVKEKWQKRIGEGELIVLPSPYRLLAEPIQEYIEQIQEEHPGCFVHVIMGHLAMDTFWAQALHQNTAFIFNLTFAQMENVAVTTVPYQIHKRDLQEAERHKDDEQIIVSQ
ncbi:MAG: APC family permease [Chloroflexi bacterium]|nr:APC family permease [Chloroflexota bacterium]